MMMMFAVFFWPANTNWSIFGTKRFDAADSFAATVFALQP